MPRTMFSNENGWHLSDNGNVKYRFILPHVTCAFSILTCEYIIKNHITKETWTGHGKNKTQTQSICTRKLLNLFRVHCLENQTRQGGDIN